MIKFPGGTPNRWEKIAVEIGRSVDEVGGMFLLSIREIGDPSMLSFNFSLYFFSPTRHYAYKDILTTVNRKR